MSDSQSLSDRPHVVIVGAGFGGLTAAQVLKHAPVRVTVIDRTNHHLFQPLLYQVATAGLSPADIAAPVRSVLHANRNTTVLLDEVTQIDLPTKTVRLKAEAPIHYDHLVIALGAVNNYFGHDSWADCAPGLKSLDDAVELRRRVLLAFEAAERESDEAKKLALLTFVVIGAGPTGVEMAGAIAELSRTVLPRDFRKIDPKETRVLLLEGGDRVLPGMAEEIGPMALRQLHELGVEVRTKTRVTGIEPGLVRLGDEVIGAVTVVWAAGTKANPLASQLGLPADHGGRVHVNKDLTLPGYNDAYAIGDMAHFVGEDGKPLPGVSPVAMQQARLVAKNIAHTIAGEPRETFVYFDKGLMATIGRSRAVAQVGKVHFGGFFAWVAWLVVHVWFLVGFRNRVAVTLSWFYSYLSFRRGARIITGDRLDAGVPGTANVTNVAFMERLSSMASRATQVSLVPPVPTPRSPERLTDAPVSVPAYDSMAHTPAE